MSQIKFMCMFDPETMAFIKTNATALGLSYSAYVRMAVREKMPAAVALRSTAVAPVSRHIPAGETAMQIDDASSFDEGEEVDEEAVFARAAGTAEAQGAFEPRYDPEPAPMREGEVRRVGGGRLSPAMGGHNGLPPAGRFGMR